VYHVPQKREQGGTPKLSKERTISASTSRKKLHHHPPQKKDQDRGVGNQSASLPEGDMPYTLWDRNLREHQPRKKWGKKKDKKIGAF